MSTWVQIKIYLINILMGSALKNINNLLKSYDITSEKIEILDGYASINYKIKCSGRNYVLKHYTDASDYNLIKEEDRVLKHLTESSFPCKIPSSVKEIKKQQDGSFTRLTEYIEGNLLSKVVQTDSLLFDFGKSVAALHRNLVGKRSDAIEARKLFWNMENTLLNRSKMESIGNFSDKKIAAYFLDLYEHHVLPIQGNLRHSLIHSDLNDNNVLVKNNKIEGVIDFGDITYAPIIYETAIALTYIMLANPEDPFQKSAQFIKGYHADFPLLKNEIKLLYYLIPSRLCVSVCNSALAKTEKKDTEYILISEKPAWQLLHKWISINPIWVNNFFLEVLGMKQDRAKTENLISDRKKYTGKSLGTNYSEPIHMTGGAFQYMFDNLGNTYLDAYNNIPHIGHCHPKISQILSLHARKLNTNTRYIYPELTNYCKKLSAKLPKKLNKFFFVNSGSAASDLAIRMARTHTKKDSIAVLENGYHGNTITGIEISSYKFNGKGGKGKSDLITSLPLPNLYHGKFASAEEYVEDAINRLKKTINKGLNPSALIVETISGCGGQVPLAQGYLEGLKPFLKENNILLITDEVQTGFGRLGEFFWGFEMQNIVPDILVLGKPMGNGHPIAAVVTTEDIADSFANGMEFFSSFGGNPVSCAVASEVLTVISEENLQNNALQTGNHLKKKLNTLKNQHPIIGDIRGYGLFLGIEFTDKTGKPDAKTASIVKNKMKEHFILLGTDGPHDNVIKIKPPLCFTIDNANQLIEQLEAILISCNLS